MAGTGYELESLLEDAKRREGDFDWLGAAKSYNRAFELASGRNRVQRGDILERQVTALYRSAFQAENNKQFRARIQDAACLCAKAKEEYAEESKTRSLRCDAMMSFLKYWITSEVSEKKRLMNDSWSLTKKALAASEKEGDDLEYARTFLQLSMSGALTSNYETDIGAYRQIMTDGLSYAEKSVEVLSRASDVTGLARVYMHASNYSAGRFGIFEDSLERIDQKAHSYLLKAMESSESVALAEISSISSFNPLPVMTGSAELSTILDKALQLGERINDKLVLASALKELASDTNWTIVAAQDSEERDHKATRALELASECRKELSVIQYDFPSVEGEIWVMAPESGVFGVMAYVESDTKRKREFAEKAVAASSEFVRLAEASDIRDVIGMAHHQFGYNLTSLAKTEPDVNRKRNLLEMAIHERDISKEHCDRFYPYDYWSKGTDLSLRAETEVELADLEQDKAEKMQRLREAVKHKKESLDLHYKSLSLQSNVDTADYGIIGQWLIQYSSWLEELHSLDNDDVTLRAAGEAWIRTADAFKSVDVPSRVAEAYWKAAQIYDDLREHMKSSERFVLASDSYRNAARRLTQLKDMYEDHSVYMQAWSEIELARYHHLRDEPGLAKEHYEKAALLHQSTKRWKHLASVYSAWAQVENAEDLSRKDKCAEAAESFKSAEELFKDSRSTIQKTIGSSLDAEEAHMRARTVRVTERGETFCKARVVLEEARLAEKQGDSIGSAERYGTAAEMFMKVLKELEAVDDRREIELIATLSKAWHAMARAEAETSPDLYGEAALIFDKARELASSEKARLMSIGHSRFCRALEAGTRFSDTGEASLHDSASRDLESAAKYYLKADLLGAAEYAKASKLLFDSYVYMDKASKEEDQDKKTRLYAMAEKVLDASTASYQKAGQPGKRNQVLKLLTKVKEDRELAMSLTEVLRAPDIVSTTMAFSTPTPTGERAMGIEKFEHADIQATLIARPKELHVGEDFSLEIELVNAGRAAAQLTKVDRFIPEGFDVVTEPDKYRIEDSYLNMKGRRLDALRTEEVKLVLKPKVQGRFRVRPRVMYLDESGTYKSFEPEPVEITVKELGIAGWLKGPEKKKQSA